MTTVGDIYRFIDSFAPFATAESWDNVGLLLGDGSDVVTAALLALDVTGPVLEEAEAMGAGLIITHHPVIFEPIKRMDSRHLVYRAVRAGVQVISAHTSLDLAPEGVNQALAQALELVDITPLCADGLGRVGRLPRAMQSGELAAFIKERLGCKGLRYCPGTGEIDRLALCGGAGGSLLEEACASGAQAYLTADIKHNVFLEAAHRGLTLLDGGHFATENVAVQSLAARLREAFPGVSFAVARSNQDVCQWI